MDMKIKENLIGLWGKYFKKAELAVAFYSTDHQFNALHNEGFMGFRTWHTELWWDNFVVTRLK